ncbi:MAG: hypothetical protein GX024_05885 [Clostridiales bacterium]|nr:hypothetical protein [Clostridiales bacterium]
MKSRPKNPEGICRYLRHQRERGREFGEGDKLGRSTGHGDAYDFCSMRAGLGKNNIYEAKANNRPVFLCKG